MFSWCRPRPQHSFSNNTKTPWTGTPPYLSPKLNKEARWTVMPQVTGGVYCIEYLGNAKFIELEGSWCCDDEFECACGFSRNKVFASIHSKAQPCSHGWYTSFRLLIFWDIVCASLARPNIFHYRMDLLAVRNMTFKKKWVFGIVNE